MPSERPASRKNPGIRDANESRGTPPLAKVRSAPALCGRLICGARVTPLGYGTTAPEPGVAVSVRPVKLIVEHSRLARRNRHPVRNLLMALGVVVAWMILNWRRFHP